MLLVTVAFLLAWTDLSILFWLFFSHHSSRCVFVFCTILRRLVCMKIQVIPNTNIVKSPFAPTSRPRLRILRSHYLKLLSFICKILCCHEKGWWIIAWIDRCTGVPNKVPGECLSDHATLTYPDRLCSIVQQCNSVTSAVLMVGDMTAWQLVPHCLVYSS